MSEFKLALKIVWITISIVSIAMLVAPSLLSADRIASLTPHCERRTNFSKECFCCGMTTAFIHIAQGRFREAVQSNRASVPLYAGFFCNGLALVGNVAAGLTQWRRSRSD